MPDKVTNVASTRCYEGQTSWAAVSSDILRIGDQLISTKEEEETGCIVSALGKSRRNDAVRSKENENSRHCLEHVAKVVGKPALAASPGGEITQS